MAGRDVLASWKVLISLVAAPILYAFYALLAVLVAIKSNAPLNWVIGTPFLVIIAVPFMNYTALKFGEAGVDVLKFVTVLFTVCSDFQTDAFLLHRRSLRPLIVALIPGQQRSLDKLKTMRVHLSNEVAELINDYGPQQFKNFDEVRIRSSCQPLRY